MKRQPWGFYAVVLAIVIVGLIAVGVPAQTLLFAALVLACPLMMIFMHGGHGGHGGHGEHDKSVDRSDVYPEVHRHEGSLDKR